MREILFRGFDNNFNVWRYGSLISYTGGQCAIVANDDRYSGGILVNEVIPETVGQDTGLKDKNGVKIFEGDILRDDEHLVIVKFFIDGGFMVDYRTMDGKWIVYGDLLDYLDRYKGKVTGNVHDNPELVED